MLFSVIEGVRAASLPLLAGGLSRCGFLQTFKGGPRFDPSGLI